MEVTSNTYFRWPTEVTSNTYFRGFVFVGRAGQGEGRREGGVVVFKRVLTSVRMLVFFFCGRQGSLVSMPLTSLPRTQKWASKPASFPSTSACSKSSTSSPPRFAHGWNPPTPTQSRELIADPTHTHAKFFSCVSAVISVAASLVLLQHWSNDGAMMLSKRW